MLTRAVVRNQAVRNSGASVEGYVKQTPSEKLNTQARADYARVCSFENLLCSTFFSRPTRDFES